MENNMNDMLMGILMVKSIADDKVSSGKQAQTVMVNNMAASSGNPMFGHLNSYMSVKTEKEKVVAEEERNAIKAELQEALAEVDRLNGEIQGLQDDKTNLETNLATEVANFEKLERETKDALDIDFDSATLGNFGQKFKAHLATLDHSNFDSEVIKTFMTEVADLQA